jgi:hypothetical protein
MVGNEHKFINDPSPSGAMIFRCGKHHTEAMEEQSPKVRTRKLPSLGRSACHSNGTAPAEVTTRVSVAAPEIIPKQSNPFICVHRMNMAHRRRYSTVI